MGLSRARAYVVSTAVVAGTVSSCYSTGDGSAPPIDRFYYPVGLQVSHGGSVLYAINSNFDLQYNGGTIQSYDLRKIRRDVMIAKDLPQDPRLPHVHPEDAKKAGCPAESSDVRESGGRTTLGESCNPPMRSWEYLRDHAVIGAFATDLRLSAPPERLFPQTPGRVAGEGLPCDAVRSCPSGLTCALSIGTCVLPFVDRPEDRLFAPVRGDATLTWASVVRDTFDQIPPEDPKAPYAPFVIDCGQTSNAERRCDARHHAGKDEPRNTRGLVFPGEPFGMAMSEDGEAIVVTHQNDRKTSLFSTGLSRSQPTVDPAMQFILDTVPFGGVGVVAVPHDREAFPIGQALPRSAFFETSRASQEVSLLRYYPDQVASQDFGPAYQQGSSLLRPFLTREASFVIAVSAGGGTDSRGIAIDPSPRIRCKAGATTEEERTACAQKRARAFIANRTPPALLVGDVGVSEGVDGAYDPDRLVLHTSIPLSAGPSKVYVAPVVERDGTYGLRVFAVCFDSATIFVYDPDAQALENVIRVAPGPFAMAFDPFTIEAAARHEPVPDDLRDPGIGLRRYSFAYVASFTQSFVQVIDLDNSRQNRATFERIVFTLGPPTNPKGS